MQRLALASTSFLALSLTVPADAATFLFIRHAESTTNAGTATADEIVDPPLTALGQQQALDLADTLRGLDLTAIYASSYQRTALTIAPTAAEFDLTPTVVPAIREWSFGDELTDTASIYTAINAMFGQWLSGNTAAAIEGIPSSESLDDLNARVVPAYDEIVARHADEDGAIAIVGHGGSIAWTMPAFAGNVTLRFAVANGLHNTGIVRVELYEGWPYVADWQGTALDWPGAQVPLPASAFLLLGAAGTLAGAARWRTRGTAI